MMKKLKLLIVTVCFAVLFSVPALAVTRDEAVNWLNAQNGCTYDVDGIWGTQCVDLVSAYMNWLVTGNPYSGTYRTYNAKDYYMHVNNDPDNWERINNYLEFVPEPGDIFVSTGLDTSMVILGSLFRVPIHIRL